MHSTLEKNLETILTKSNFLLNGVSIQFKNLSYSETTINSRFKSKFSTK